MDESNSIGDMELVVEISSPCVFPDSSLAYLLSEFEKIVRVIKHGEFGPKLKKVFDVDDQEVYDFDEESNRVNEYVRFFLTMPSDAATPATLIKAAHFWMYLYVSMLSKCLNFQGIGATSTVDQLSIIDRLEILETSHEKVCAELEKTRKWLKEKHDEFASTDCTKQLSEGQIYFINNIVYEKMLKMPVILVLLFARTLSCDDPKLFKGQNMNIFTFKIWRDTLNAINADKYLQIFNPYAVPSTVTSSSENLIKSSKTPTHHKQPPIDGWHAARRDEQLLKYCIFKRWADYYENEEQSYDREMMLSVWLQEGIDYYNLYAPHWKARQFDTPCFPSIKATAAFTWINDVVAEVSRMVDASLVIKPASNFVDDLVVPGESREARKRWLYYFCHLIHKKRQMRSRKRSLGAGYLLHHSPSGPHDASSSQPNKKFASEMDMNAFQQLTQLIPDIPIVPISLPSNSISTATLTPAATTITTSTTPIAASITSTIASAVSATSTSNSSSSSGIDAVPSTQAIPTDGVAGIPTATMQQSSSETVVDHVQVSLDNSIDSSIGGENNMLHAEGETAASSSSTTSSSSTSSSTSSSNSTDAAAVIAPSVMTTTVSSEGEERLMKVLVDSDRKQQDMLRALMLQVLQLQGQQVTMQSELSQLRLQAQQTNVLLAHMTEWIKYTAQPTTTTTLHPAHAVQTQSQQQSAASIASLSALFPSFASLSTAIAGSGGGGNVGFGAGLNNSGTADNFAALMLQQAQQQQQQQQQQSAVSTPFVIPSLFPMHK